MVVKTPNFKGVLSKVSLNLCAKNYYTAMFSDDYIGLWVASSILVFESHMSMTDIFLLSLAWQSTIRCFYRYNAKTGMLGRLNNKCLLSAQWLPFFDWFRILVLYKNIEASSDQNQNSGHSFFLVPVRSIWLPFWILLLVFVVTLEPLSRSRSCVFFLFLLQNK